MFLALLLSSMYMFHHYRFSVNLFAILGVCDDFARTLFRSSHHSVYSHNWNFSRGTSTCYPDLYIPFTHETERRVTDVLKSTIF